MCRKVFNALRVQCNYVVTKTRDVLDIDDKASLDDIKGVYQVNPSVLGLNLLNGDVLYGNIFKLTSSLRSPRCLASLQISFNRLLNFLAIRNCQNANTKSISGARAARSVS